MTMDKNVKATFLKKMSVDVLESRAVKHPYLTAMSEGTLPNIEWALQDFAFQYGLYSRKFIHYLSAVIENLDKPEHKEILRGNLAEEQGNVHDIDLPTDVLASIAGQPHTLLYRRFQESLGIDKHYRETTPQCQAALLWSQQFLHLCQTNKYVGIGAIGIGTEFIVSSIYRQILECIKAHSDLTITQRIFFDLHSDCDEEHAAQILLIAEDLAIDTAACEQIEYGVNMAITMRSLFWDKMLERAKTLSTPIASTVGGLSIA